MSDAADFEVYATTFTGDTCDYSGPTGIVIGSTLTFRFINQSETTDVGFSIWTVPDGTTPDDIMENGIFEVVGPEETSPHKFYNFVPTPNAIGQPADVTVTLDTTGTHALICFDASSVGGADIDHAAIFEVTSN